MLFVRRLLWDAWNVAHLARHRIRPAEVEEVCQGNHLARRAKAGRFLLTGTTVAGRPISVVLAPRARGVYYVVTARPASRNERRRLEQSKGRDGE